jgi:hypothetical protein
MNFTDRIALIFFNSVLTKTPKIASSFFLDFFSKKKSLASLSKIGPIFQSMVIISYA